MASTIAPGVEHDKPKPGEPVLRCDSCAVRNRAVCGALSRTEIAQLNAIAHTKTFAPGQIVYGEDEDVHFFANIVAGAVKLTKALSDGREQIVGLQFASDFLGRPFRARSPFHAEAVTTSQLCMFDKAKFERLVREHQGLEHRLFQHALDELDAAEEWMLLLGRKSAGEKVASFLLMVAKRMHVIGCHGPSEGPQRFDLPLTRAAIADYLGLTIETVSRQFTRLKAEKIIGLEGARTVILISADRLRAAAERSD